jgi:hypothetical protein
MRVMYHGDDVILVYEPEVSLARRMLIIEEPGSRTLVARYPLDWHRLSDDELLALKRDGFSD